MASALLAAQYWGYLIQPDKTPTRTLEQLLLGIANYIALEVTPWRPRCLTPTKLANFYRLVGGNYDALFLDTSEASLSFIYQSLGCYHTLQPEKNPYLAPKVPALTPQGFVRWQTIQLLLEPEDHVGFLQEAVKHLKITHPETGQLFPKFLPSESLPCRPDPEMTQWHDMVSEKLMLEAQASRERNIPPRPPMALSDVDVESSRPSSSDSHSQDSHSLTDTAHYFPPQRPSYSHPQPQYLHPHYQNEPWSPIRRNLSRNLSFPSHPSTRPQNPPLSRHARTISELSTDSCASTSSTSSVSTSSASRSPVRYQSAPAAPPRNQRRHSAQVIPTHSMTHPGDGNGRREQVTYSGENGNSDGRGTSVKGVKVRWVDLREQGRSRSFDGKWKGEEREKGRGQGGPRSGRSKRYLKADRDF